MIETALGFISSLFTLKLLLLIALVVGGKSCVYVVRGKTARILETLGKPHTRAAMPGIHFKLPYPITCLVGTVNLQLGEIAADVAVKTSDNAMLGVPVKVQYKASDTPEGAVKAHYELRDPKEQITSYVLNVVRQTVSGMDMGEVYSNRNTIEQGVAEHMRARFAEFGYTIENVLVDQPQPHKDVVDAFNRVITSKRDLEAASNEADAEKRRRIGKAEAEKESKRLQGEGIRMMREEVAKGAAAATKQLKEAMPELADGDIAEFLLSITRLDSMTQVGEHGNLVLMDLRGDPSALGKTIAAVKTAGHGNVMPLVQQPTHQ